MLCTPYSSPQIRPLESQNQSNLVSSRKRTMVTLRNEPRTLETPVNAKQTNNHEQPESIQSKDVSGYEQCREKRMKENMERMQKLGLFELSSKLKSEIRVPKRTPRRTPQSTPVQSFLPSRRSSRLQDAPAVRYSELPEEKVVRVRGKRGINSGPLVGEGPRPEVYTEEHEKLLGTCESTWTLFVDGIGSDGKRIYDPIKGKTCHQCRQKTLGHRTHCSTCTLVQGQFCGDCLYMRYGEHVLEVKKNPDWVCPPCRGICNCSLCRQAKGWPPTGALYRKITSLGFKSVAHYLIQTRHAEEKSDDVVAEEPASAKRSLKFKGTEEAIGDKDSANSDSGQPELPKNFNALEDKNESASGLGDKASLNSDSGHQESPKHSSDERRSDGLEEEKMKIASEAEPDSISLRLRQRCKKPDAKTKPVNLENELNKENEKEEVNILVEDEARAEKVEPTSEDCVIKTVSPKRKRKSVVVNEPNPDSISGRLGQRRNRS